MPKPRSEIDAAANLLIRNHGADAELEAAKRADLMLDRGDDDGRLLWMRIRRAIEALQAGRGATGATLRQAELGRRRNEGSSCCQRRVAHNASGKLVSHIFRLAPVRFRRQWALRGQCAAHGDRKCSNGLSDFFC